MNPNAELTRQEKRVAERIAWGATQREIADELFVSRKTIDAHTVSIYRKTECSKSSELSAWWFCKTYKISFDLSPRKRCVIAFSLLILLLPVELIYRVDVIRTRTVKTAQVRARTNRKSDETDYLFNS